jgi:Glycosyltransferase
MRPDSRTPAPTGDARPLRIVQVLHSHGYGGAEQHALALMKGLRERGHEVLYAGPSDSWLAGRCAEAGIDHEHLAMVGMYDVVSWLRLRRLVARWRADIVHGHLLRGARYAGWACGRAAAVGTAHATTARKHMQDCRELIAVAEAVRRTLVDAGYDARRITVIHNGVADQPGGDRAALRRELGIGEDEFAVFNAGRFIPDKGQHLLVEAIGQVPGARLYLAGDPATDYGRGVQEAARGRAEVTFLGYRGDVRRLLPAFDAYASSSYREAFPLSLVEAACAGLPIVATDVGGVAEIVRDGQTGVLVPPGNAQALAAALARLAREPARAQALGRQARQLYAGQFTLEHMVTLTEAVYRRALQGGGAR